MTLLDKKKINVYNSIFKYSKFKTPIGFLMTLENIYWSKIFLIEYILKASFYENLNIQALISQTYF